MTPTSAFLRLLYRNDLPLEVEINAGQRHHHRGDGARVNPAREDRVEWKTLLVGRMGRVADWPVFFRTQYRHSKEF